MFGRKQEAPLHGISDEFRDRCAALKLQLVNYVIENHREALEFQADRLVDEFGTMSDHDMTHVVDAAIHETRFSDGEHILERFVADHDDLCDEDVNLLLSWRDWLVGVFQVTSSDGPVVDSINLVDDLEYRLVVTNDSPETRRALRHCGFIVSRIVPVENSWMISGEQRVLAKDEEMLAYGLAAELAQKSPKLFFRNPANLALAREHLQDEYERFLEEFGAPWIMGTWDVIQDRWRKFTFAKANEEFKSRGERTLSLPAGLRDAETVGMVFDPDGGLLFLKDFGLFLAALNEPASVRKPTIHSTVYGYLTDRGVAPIIFELVWRQQPAKLNALLGCLLGRPDFDWARMGEGCLREYNPLFLDEPRYPGLLPLNSKQVEGLRYMQEQKVLWETGEMSAMANHSDTADLTGKGTKTTSATPRKTKRKRKMVQKARKRNRR